MLTLNRPIRIGLGVALLLIVGGAGFWLGSGSDNATTRGDSVTIRLAGESPPPIRRWELQAQYKGPLKDTIVQRWRDPGTGMLCYIYLPVVVQHQPPLQNGMVHYGANDIGSISCVEPHA